MLLAALILIGAMLPRVVVGLASHHAGQDKNGYAVTQLMRLPNENVPPETNKPTANSAQALYVNGLRAHWSGEEATAEALLTQASEAGGFSADLLTTIGNVRFARGNREGALQAYQQAVETDPKHVIAYFNLAQTYYALGDNIKGGEAHRTASEIDIRALSALTEHVPKAAGSDTYVAPNPPPPWLFGDTKVHTVMQKNAVDRVWRWLCPISSRRQFSLVAAVALLFIIVLSVLQKTALPSTSCERCGEAACQKCSPRLPNRAFCGTCYGVFVEQIDADDAQRVRREIKVRRHLSKNKQIASTLSVLIAGAGHLYRGFSLLGVAYLFVFCMSVITFLAAMQILPSFPLSLFSGPRWGTAALAAVTMVLVFVISLWDFGRHQEE